VTLKSPSSRGQARAPLNPSAANEVQNEHHQSDYDQDVNQATGDVERQAAEPEQQ
jgi:hypothetical protein